MDTPRRWQVASLATAVASLGLGGAVLARPSIEEVPSIDLDQVTAHAELTPRPPRATGSDGDPIGPLIVLPQRLPPEPDDVTPTASTASPDDEDDPPASSEASEPAPPPDRPVAPAVPDDSPASADDALDSPTSVDSTD